MNVLTDSFAIREEAAKLVKRGLVIAFRTDTFYGLGADPFHPRAIERLKTLKGREEGKPILVVISDLSDAERLVATRTTAFQVLTAAYWPGPLTLVAPARPEIPAELTAHTGTVGVRLPADAEVRALVKVCGGALTATSANPAGLAPARTAHQVRDYFADRVALIIDSGETQSTQPSTVVDVCDGDHVALIREGVISWQSLQQTLQAQTARPNGR